AASQRARLQTWLGADTKPKAPTKASGVQVTARAFTELDVIQLRPDRAVPPIADLDELIDRLAAVLEEPGDADEIERRLAGVSRLCADKPVDFGRRTGPLAKRAGTLLKRSWAGPFMGVGPLPDLCGLALAWITGEIPTTEPGRKVHKEGTTVLDFLSRRVRAV